ncbi:hypothetical protein DNH61_09655 [Paenibacillus sambharensis]|uniref:DUF1850 domain-containing protein n=1 Tax=Paenibacillus sambharensis TaxID=1803190 RepID=A0A2W1LWJ9_9BACL|nr:DUF1850 domain-containing protein [Paenibacillus sambharensis]PZD96161.1 hypothetical protein DNH61_09655 [Paenibacillus sambharensis]
MKRSDHYNLLEKRIEGKGGVRDGNALFTPFRIAAAIALLTAAAITANWGMLPGSSLKLEIVKASTDDVLWQTPIQEGEKLYYQYIHSVELSPVIEYYTADQDLGLIAVESRTRSFGAGLPYAFKGDTELADGFYIMKNLNEPIGELHMQPSYLYPFTLHIREESVLLHRPPYARTHLILRINRPARWRELLGI